LFLKNFRFLFYMNTMAQTQTIPVIILCGGKSTRMGDRTLPKPLVEVGDRPVLWHVMKIYATQGFNHFILALGYRGEMIKRYFLEYEWQSRDFTMTIGDGTERFFVTYADGVADIDLHALLAFHRQQGRLATMTGARAFSRFGIVEADGTGRVTGFQEKPRETHIINGGFMVFERHALSYFEGGDDLVLEQAPLRNLAADGQLSIYEHHGFWRAMDTFKEAQELTSLWEENAPWKLWADEQENDHE
jgi:glucose-1-phosphate cytidylyltransferase